MPMDASQLNPFIRYMDLRCGSISYSEPIKAYDYRLFAIREGECAAETETKRLTLRAGSCLIIPPDHAYRMLFHRDAPAMLYNINFSLSYLPGNGQAFRPDPPARFRPERMPELPDPAFFPIPTLFQDVPQIQQTAALLLSEREKRDVYFNELCSALLKGMLLQLMREPKAGEKPVPTVVERLKQYLEAHSRERITADSLGRMFGFHYKENFNYPYIARSATEFWRRWHITLGAWMRDYVFYPLSLSKAFGRLSRWARTHIRGTGGKIFATSLATFIVYLIIGIWHGANFRYIAFGLWNGVLITASLLLERTFLRWKAALHINDKSAAWRVFMTLRTMLLVFIGRYFTRSPRLSCVFRFLKTTVLHPQPSQLLDGTLLSFGLAKTDFLVIALGLAVLLTLECLQERGVQIRAALEKKSGFVQWLAVTALLLAVLLLGVFRAGYIPSGFIYTQF